MAQSSGNSGLAFIVGGLVVAVIVILYIITGGSFFGLVGGGDTTNVSIEAPAIVVPAGD